MIRLFLPALSQEEPKVHYFVHRLFEENNVFKEYKTDMFPASVSSESRTKIKKAKRELYKKKAARVKTKYLKLKLDERVVIIKLNYKSSDGTYNRILIEDFEKDDEDYAASPQTIVDEYLASAMDKEKYDSFKVLHDGAPFSIPKESNTSYFDELYKVIKKEIMPYLESEDKKQLEEGIQEEKKKAIAIGVRG